ncbi:hypothetical protein [Flavobacterium faecale]|uniref:hypothetical protein n=1 Tax=Flavobacterium faecale TaxID=1355330 RepID=UPI003AADDFEC
MKKFLKYIVFLFLLILGILYLLDYSFTTVYEKAVPRTKIQYLRSLKGKKIDYIFLGSSRVENAIIPKLIYDKTGKSAINLGFPASKLNDVFTILKLIKKYQIKFHKVYIQVDYIYNMEDGHSNVLEWQLMPFINENEITRAYFNQYFRDNREVSMIPFYRYCRYEPKIGFREFFLNTLDKSTPLIKNLGFIPLEGTSSNSHYSLPAEIKRNNKCFDQIDLFVRENNMNVSYFCAPFSLHAENLSFVEKLQLKIPGLYNFSKVVTNDAMFQNYSHLNRDGATFFTEIIIEKMLKDK